ncbi:MAG TPA: hypothetical protein VGN72_13095 [Tepidisphaeraceae bacterium]|nr:hypothetical protein [Tepidisphaeraceae bacterium]
MSASLLPEFDLAHWAQAEVRPVAPDGSRHTTHSYFNACPESPDGRHVLYFSSTDPEGESGDICILERATGKETALASGVATEDAHRVACQQWVNDGRTVVYHDHRDRRWFVMAVDIETQATKVLAEDRQIGFGSPTQPLVPVYGCHWNPGPNRDLELIDVRTGQRRAAVTSAAVIAEYREWTNETFGTDDLSIFFPILSPDGNRVFFKMARPSGGDDFRSPKASERQGNLVYDLRSRRFVRMFTQWGHPSWHPDSNQIFEKGNVLFNLETTGNRQHCGESITDHPSVGPDGRLFVTDGNYSRRPTGRPGEQAIVVGSLERDEFVVVTRFLNNGGARSWRRNHPHPVFTADGQRIYYNVSDGDWTRLMVASPSQKK